MISISLFVLAPAATSTGLGGGSAILVLGLLGNFPMPINWPSVFVMTLLGGAI